jgi:hypothetical protein
MIRARSKAAPTAALVASIALAGCGHVETHDIVLRAPDAASPRDPDLYIEGRGPARAFYEAALIQVVGFGSDANPDDVTLGLLARGRALGCDALVRMHIDQGAARASGFAVCVRWSPVRAPAASPAPAESPPPSPPAAPSSAPPPQPSPTQL